VRQVHRIILLLPKQDDFYFHNKRAVILTDNCALLIPSRL
jgi:hypothetical protein